MVYLEVPALRVVVFSDVHGNLTALDAALGEIRALAPDFVVCAGDIAQFGPQPNECIQRLAEQRIPCVRGNHDQDFLEPIPIRADTAPAARMVAEIHNWGHNQLSPHSKQYLASLPFSWRCRQVAAASLLVVHASPDSDKEIILGNSLEVIAKHCTRAECAAIVAGHLHTPFIAAEGPYLWVNAGSCGAAMDGDPRGAFAILDWNKGRWKAQIRRFDYDLDQADVAFLSSAMPHAQKLSQARRSATWLSP